VHYLTQPSYDFSEQASIDFQTTQERQHYSSPGDGHHPLIWSETLNRSRQSNPHFTQHNIPFSATDTKKVLCEKIKQKETPVVYKTDKIANLHGHKVLRTPVRHCELIL
jgi:hypothetical protein